MFMPALALAFFLFLPWPFALATYMPIAVFSLAVAYKAIQAQHQSPVIGQEAMIGDRAVVVSNCVGETGVRYRGEIWRANSSHELRRGQQVVIEDVNGLTLWVTLLASDRTQDGKPANRPNKPKNNTNSKS
ncbi:MAG: NfeD family protein [Candidatus Promineifilaceae bacterium]